MNKVFRILYKLGVFPNEVTHIFSGGNFNCPLPYGCYDTYLDGKFVWSNMNATADYVFNVSTSDPNTHTIVLKAKDYERRHCS